MNRSDRKSQTRSGSRVATAVLCLCLTAGPAAANDDVPADVHGRLADIVLNISADRHFQRVGAALPVARQAWSAHSYLLYDQRPGKADRWAYSGVVAYKPAAGQQLSFETTITLGRATSRTLSLTYGAQISDTWSARLFIWRSL